MASSGQGKRVSPSWLIQPGLDPVMRCSSSDVVQRQTTGERGDPGETDQEEADGSSRVAAPEGAPAGEACSREQHGDAGDAEPEREAVDDDGGVGWRAGSRSSRVLIVNGCQSAS